MGTKMVSTIGLEYSLLSPNYDIYANVNLLLVSSTWFTLANEMLVMWQEWKVKGEVMDELDYSFQHHLCGK